MCHALNYTIAYWLLITVLICGMEPMHGDRGAGSEANLDLGLCLSPIPHTPSLDSNKIVCFHIGHWYYLTLSYLVTDIECLTTWYDMP